MILVTHELSHSTLNLSTDKYLLWRIASVINRIMQKITQLSAAIIFLYLHSKITAKQIFFPKSLDLAIAESSN